MVCTSCGRAFDAEPKGKVLECPFCRSKHLINLRLREPVREPKTQNVEDIVIEVVDDGVFPERYVDVVEETTPTLKAEETATVTATESATVETVEPKSKKRSHKKKT
jgi:DNA-directed RNA polymerase subunit RPC12/RpoP